MKSIKEESEGFILSLDLLLALIPLTILIGMVAADMDNMLYLVQDTVYRSSTDRVCTDTVNTLLGTSGSPVDWELTGNVNTVGLADYDPNKKIPIEGTISPSKLAALKESHIQDIIGDNYGFYLNISSVSNGASIKILGNYDSNASDIINVERLVSLTHLKVVSSIKDTIRDAGVPRIYTSPPDPFPTNNYYLGIYDYWALVINRGYDSATVEINNNRVIDPNDFNGQGRYITITRQANETFLYNQTAFQDNTVTVRTTSNPGASMDVYVIQVPKGTNKNEINLENVIPKKYRFRLYLWTK